MPRSLVTGSTGFIGANLALELEARDHEVVALTFPYSSDRRNLTGFRGKTVEADVSQPFEIAGPLDYIFHQAALTDPRYADDEEIYAKNLSGFRQVLSLAREKGAALIYASSAGVYGNGPLPMKEDQPKELLTAYARSKQAMDEMAERSFGERRLVGLRYFNVFGPREAHKGRPASMILHLSRQMREGKRPRLFRAGEHTRDFIYVKDVVEANLRAMHAPSGIYNVGTGVKTSFNELVALLNRALGTDLPPEYFAMPFDASTYQSHTQAYTRAASERLGFTAEWALPEAIRDYLDWLADSELERSGGVG